MGTFLRRPPALAVGYLCPNRNANINACAEQPRGRARFREIRFIFCHCGGTLPMVYGRILQNPPKNLAERAPNGIDYELRKLYYDVAATAVRPAMAALTSLVPTSQILLGTDNPYVPAENTVRALRQLGFSAAELRAIGRDNALGLLPGLKR